MFSFRSKTLDTLIEFYWYRLSRDQHKNRKQLNPGQHLKPRNIPSEKGTIYLTFNDGPNEGTPLVLDVLKQYNVRGTFFINGINLADHGDTFIRQVKEGHVIGDLSYNHMIHNNKKDTHINVYLDPEIDVLYFGNKNIEAVKTLLKESGESENEASSMEYIVRLPYTDNWRAKHIHHDCLKCTEPLISGVNGRKLADLLAAERKQVFGWDLTWEMDFNTNRYTETAKDFLERVVKKANRKTTKIPGKIVVLSHDVAHRPGTGVFFDGVLHLGNFIKHAKQRGYTFDTLDHYFD